MMHLASTVGLLFFMLLWGSAVCVRHAQKTKCLDDTFEFVLSESKRCFQQHGVAGFKFPWEDGFWSFIDSFMNSEVDVCQQSLQNQFAEAYHCAFNSSLDCLQQIRAQALNKGSVSISSSHYMPDPEMFAEAIQYVCKTADDEEDLVCLDNPVIMSGLLVCGMRKVTEIIKHVQTIIRKPTRSSINSIRQTVCFIFEGLNQCIAEHTKQCTPKAVEFLTTIVHFLTPPACQHGLLNEEIDTLEFEEALISWTKPRQIK